MRIAIVEDRPEDQKCLFDLLTEDARRRGWIYTIKIYTSGETFLKTKENFDIVFLDIIMDEIDGLETARRFRAKGGSALKALMVFVTVDADFAIEGYEVDAVAFLVKPVDATKFRRTLDRLERKMIARKRKNGPWVVLAPGQKIPAGMIVYATIKDHYLKVYTAGEIISPNLSMEELRARLPDDGRFVECSRGILVNLDHVSQVGATTATMDNGTCLPISRRRRQALIGAIAARKFGAVRGDMSQ